MKLVALADNQANPERDDSPVNYDQRWDELLAELRSDFRPSTVVRFLRRVIGVKMQDLRRMPTLRRSYWRVTTAIILVVVLWHIGLFTRGITAQNALWVGLGHLAYYSIICPLVWMNLHRIQNPPHGEPPGVDHWTLPNLISYTRLLFVPAMFSAIVVPFYARYFALPIFGLYVLLWASDFADGQISRSFGLQSYFGRLFDPFVDIIFHLFMAVGLWISGILPWWFCLPVLMRYLLPLVGSFIYLIWRGGYEISATFIGKVTGFIIGVAIGLGILVQFVRPEWRHSDVFRGWLYVATGVSLANLSFIVFFGLRLISQDQQRS